jgi:NTE family protein
MIEKVCSRRRFLGLMTAALSGGFILRGAGQAMAGQKTQMAGTSCSKKRQPSIGIALGAGGANGLSHIMMLEALDEMGIKVSRIAGSSIGAIIGSLYAAGMSGKKIRDLVERFVLSHQEKPLTRLMEKDAFEWINFVEIELGNGGLVSADGFLAFMSDILKKKKFEELEMPIEIVAADLWAREQVVLASGDLISAINASMAIPGVFEPVRRDGRVLIDGGTCNPVPYDLLMDHCDIVIAVDVIGERTQPSSGVPGYFETIFNSVKVMQTAVMNEKRQQQNPAIYLAVPVVDIRALEFYRAQEVFAQSVPARDMLMQQLPQVIEKWEAAADFQTGQ